jgi:hypothetical protein
LPPGKQKECPQQRISWMEICAFRRSLLTPPKIL